MFVFPKHFTDCRNINIKELRKGGMEKRAHTFYYTYVETLVYWNHVKPCYTKNIFYLI